MEERRLDPHAGLSDYDAGTTSKQSSHSHPTPGDVLAKIAGVIAICLGLALIVQPVIPPPPGL